MRDSRHAEDVLYGKLDFTRLTKGQEQAFWNRLNWLALEESLLVHCKKPDNFAQTAREAIRACVTKEALDRADSFFSSKVTTFVSGWVKNGQKCGPEPLEARGILGVNVNRVETRSAPNGGEIKPGVLVLGVIPSSPAAAAGIKKDDLITSINGQRVSNYEDLRSQLSREKTGTEVKQRRQWKVGIERNGMNSVAKVFFFFYDRSGKISFDAPAAIKYDTQDLQRVLTQITDLCQKCKSTVFSLFCR